MVLLDDCGASCPSAPQDVLLYISTNGLQLCRHMSALIQT